MQIATYLGADVTGVCSAANVELVRSLGANRVIDYTRHDFTESGETYDVIVDTAGTAPFARSRQRAEYVRFLAELAEAGKYKPVIDRSYPFAQIVEAHRYVDRGHKKGSVVIRLDH